MLAAIAVILIILWLLGFFAFHVTSAFIHLVLIIGLILLVLHFVRGRSAG
ncbi:MAG: lmo0937 family membrane protein [Candidatus Acidiferrales bacterium]